MSLFPHVQFLISAAQSAQFPADQGAEVAFAGRSNAGKSSAINIIVQRHALARVSKTPGRTRLLNFFEIGANKRIVDLPGYGYAAAPEAEKRTWGPMIAALRERQSLRGLVLIVDSRRGVAPEDENLIAWAREGAADEDARRAADKAPASASEERNGLLVHVLLSKSDKLNRTEGAKVLREAKAKLGDTVSVQLFSALSKTGVDEAQRVLQQWTGSGAK